MSSKKFNFAFKNTNNHNEVLRKFNENEQRRIEKNLYNDLSFVDDFVFYIKKYSEDITKPYLGFFRFLHNLLGTPEKEVKINKKNPPIERAGPEYENSEEYNKLLSICKMIAEDYKENQDKEKLTKRCKLIVLTIKNS